MDATNAEILINGQPLPCSCSYTFEPNTHDTHSTAPPTSKYEYSATFSISKRAAHKFLNHIIERSIAFPQLSRAKALNWPKSSRRKRALIAANSLYNKQYKELVNRMLNAH